MEDQASDKAEDKTADEVKDESKNDVEDLSKSEVKDQSESEVKDVNKAEATPEAVAAKADTAVPAAKAKSSGRRSTSDLSIIDLSFAVLLLVVLSLLVANSYVAYLARSYNERICAESIALAGQAANDGLDTAHVQLAAYGSWEHCADPGFFVEHPQLIGFKDEITQAKDDNPALRVITVSLSTKIQVPAPFLIMDKSNLDPTDDYFQHITFKNTCQYRLTNPKISGTKIRTPDGKIIFVPGKNGAPAVKPGAPTPIAAPKPATKPASKPAAKPNP